MMYKEDIIKTYFADWVMMNFNCKAIQKEEIYLSTQVITVKFLCYLGR
jgi:hypothetical protein